MLPPLFLLAHLFHNEAASISNTGPWWETMDILSPSPKSWISLRSSTVLATPLIHGSYSGVLHTSTCDMPALISNGIMTTLLHIKCHELFVIYALTNTNNAVQNVVRRDFLQALQSFPTRLSRASQLFFLQTFPGIHIMLRTYWVYLIHLMLKRWASFLQVSEWNWSNL